MARDLKEKKPLSISDVNQALAKAFADYGREVIEDMENSLFFGLVIGADIANRVIEELFGKEDEE